MTPTAGRSQFDCYAQVSGILSAHLQTIIELDHDQAAASDIPLIFESLAAKIGFMRNDVGCGRTASNEPQTAWMRQLRRSAKRRARARRPPSAG